MLKSDRERIEDRCIPEPNTGCWIWLGGMHREGRAVLAGQIAARVSYAAYFGAIPDGLSVLHKCDEPVCVNPGHLFLGTQADNVRDMIRKGRSKLRNNGGVYDRSFGDGVSKYPKRDRWRAYYYEDGRQHHIGTFSSREEAIAARSKALAA